MQHGRPLHGTAVVGVQDERLLTKEQALGQDSFSDEMAGMFSGFLLPDFPAHDVTAEDVEDEVEVVVEPLDGTGKVGNVPGPDLGYPPISGMSLGRGPVPCRLWPALHRRRPPPLPAGSGVRDRGRWSVFLVL